MMTQTPNFIARSGIAHMTCDTGYKFCDLLPLAFSWLVAVGILWLVGCHWHCYSCCGLLRVHNTNSYDIFRYNFVLWQ